MTQQANPTCTQRAIRRLWLDHAWTLTYALIVLIAAIVVALIQGEPLL